MAKLTIDFQTGFSGEDVEIRVNGVPVATRSSLKTNRLTGLAGSVAAEVEPGNAEVEVSVPRLRLHQKMDVRVADAAYLGISIEGAELVLFQSGREFGYA